LTGKLPPNVRRMRLTTSFEARWDQIALYQAVPTSAARVSELRPATAELQWHGFAELRPVADDKPQVPNLARLTNTPPWLTAVEGWCTRYGDIRPLVVESDAMMAILNSGDGATMEFDAGQLPPLPTDMARTLLVYTRGWIKEADPNSLADRRVEPLPEIETVKPIDDDWQLEFNTRWVPSNLTSWRPD
jgi:hypothetical protein